MEEPPENMPRSDPVQTLRGELEAARAENEMLLQQMTRLCLYIEQSTGMDPIEVMHGRVALPDDESPPRPARPAPPPVEEERRGWIGGLLSRAAGLRGNSNGNSNADDTLDAPGNRAYVDGASVPVVANANIEEDDEPPTIIAGGTFEWRGDPEAMSELELKLTETKAVAEVTLDGTGLTRLPSSLAMWTHLARTVTLVSLNGNGLVELPSAFGRLRGLRKLLLEGNLLRELPAPVLKLTRLEELGLACNQLTGLPEAFGDLTSLQELWLVSNEISYLPQSIGQLKRLRKLELSDNGLHELPRSFGKLSGLTHLWLNSNSLSVFPQQLCALDHVEVLDVQANRLTVIPRAVSTMPSLHTLLLANNPLAFPPAGVIAQGPTQVLEYLRRHRQTDPLLMTSDAERSLKQVLAYRDRLANTVDAHEESHRHLMLAAKEGTRADDDDAKSTDGTPERKPHSREPDAELADGAQKPRRTRNASYFN